MDDQIAGKVSNDKLMEIGLMYGDMLAFRQFFGSGSTEQFVSYEERAAELKKKIKRNHVFGRNVNDKPIKAPQTIKVTFGLKCLERRVYVAKRNKGFSHDFDRTATYDELHTHAQNNFGVQEKVKTYLALHNGHKLLDFRNLEEFAARECEKRKKPLCLYLYYPNTYGNLEFKKFMKDTKLMKDTSSDEDDFDAFDLCSTPKLVADSREVYIQYLYIYIFIFSQVSLTNLA